MRLFLIALLASLLTACATPPASTQHSSHSLSLSPDALLSSGDSTDLPVSSPDRMRSADELARAQKFALNAADAAGDLWARVRDGFQMPDLNDGLVQKHLAGYASQPTHIARVTARAKRYLYHIIERLEARQMPTELALLPFIESAYNPRALSVAKASGLWQFIPATGREYALTQNMFRDERRDVLASTHAALDYLSKLYEMFGDWHLALAAYNWGEGNVQRAILRNHRAGLPTDYASLRMPTETRHYVPKLQAIKKIILNPRHYQVELAEIPDHPYFSTVTVTRDMDVQVVAQLAGLSLQEFRALNPSFSKPIIVGAAQPKILLPFKNAQKFEATLKNYAGSLSSWTTHTVAKRMRPSELAAKIKVDPLTLISVNKIPTGRWIKPGSTLLIPRDESNDEDISAEVAESAQLIFEPMLSNLQRRVIRVRRNQTIAEFARRYHVSVAQLHRWNRMRRMQLTPGQTLVLYQPISVRMRARPLRTVAVPYQRTVQAQPRAVRASMHIPVHRKASAARSGQRKVRAHPKARRRISARK